MAYSTFLPTPLNNGQLQATTAHQDGTPTTQMTFAPQQLQNNRLSYIASNTPPANPAPIVKLPLASNGNNLTYGTLNNSRSINRDPNGVSSDQAASNMTEQARPTALVSSYISSLNNCVSY